MVPHVIMMNIHVILFMVNHEKNLKYHDYSRFKISGLRLSMGLNWLKFGWFSWNLRLNFVGLLGYPSCVSWRHRFMGWGDTCVINYFLRKNMLYSLKKSGKLWNLKIASLHSFLYQVWSSIFLIQANMMGDNKIVLQLMYVHTCNTTLAVLNTVPPKRHIRTCAISIYINLNSLFD